MTEQLGPNSTNTSQNNTRQSLPKGETTVKSDSSLRVSETRDINAKAELEKNSQNSAKKDGVTPKSKQETTTHQVAQSVEKQRNQQQIQQENQINSETINNTQQNNQETSKNEGLHNDLFNIFENLIKKKTKKKGSIVTFTSIPKVMDIIQQSLEELDNDIQKYQIAKGLNDIKNALDKLLTSSDGDLVALLRTSSETSEDKIGNDEQKAKENLKDALRNEDEKLIEDSLIEIFKLGSNEYSNIENNQDDKKTSENEQKNKLESKTDKKTQNTDTKEQKREERIRKTQISQIGTKLHYFKQNNDTDVNNNEYDKSCASNQIDTAYKVLKTAVSENDLTVDEVKQITKERNNYINLLTESKDERILDINNYLAAIESKDQKKILIARNKLLGIETLELENPPVVNINNEETPNKENLDNNESKEIKVYSKKEYKDKLHDAVNTPLTEILNTHGNDIFEKYLNFALGDNYKVEEGINKEEILSDVVTRYVCKQVILYYDTAYLDISRDNNEAKFAFNNLITQIFVNNDLNISTEKQGEIKNKCAKYILNSIKAYEENNDSKKYNIDLQTIKLFFESENIQTLKELNDIGINNIFTNLSIDINNLKSDNLAIKENEHLKLLIELLQIDDKKLEEISEINFSEILDKDSKYYNLIIGLLSDRVVFRNKFLQSIKLSVNPNQQDLQSFLDNFGTLSEDSFLILKNLDYKETLTNNKNINNLIESNLIINLLEQDSKEDALKVYKSKDFISYYETKITIADSELTTFNESLTEYTRLSLSKEKYKAAKSEKNKENVLEESATKAGRLQAKLFMYEVSKKYPELFTAKELEEISQIDVKMFERYIEDFNTLCKDEPLLKEKLNLIYDREFTKDTRSIFVKLGFQAGFETLNGQKYSEEYESMRGVVEKYSKSKHHTNYDTTSIITELYNEGQRLFNQRFENITKLTTKLYTVRNSGGMSGMSSLREINTSVIQEINALGFGKYTLDRLLTQEDKNEAIAHGLSKYNQISNIISGFDTDKFYDNKIQELNVNSDKQIQDKEIKISDKTTSIIRELNKKGKNTSIDDIRELAQEETKLQILLITPSISHDEYLSAQKSLEKLIEFRESFFKTHNITFEYTLIHDSLLEKNSFDLISNFGFTLTKNNFLEIASIEYTEENHIKLQEKFSKLFMSELGIKNSVTIFENAYNYGVDSEKDNITISKNYAVRLFDDSVPKGEKQQIIIDINSRGNFAEVRKACLNNGSSDPFIRFRNGGFDTTLTDSISNLFLVNNGTVRNSKIGLDFNKTTTLSNSHILKPKPTLGKILNITLQIEQQKEKGEEIPLELKIEEAFSYNKPYVFRSLFKLLKNEEDPQKRNDIINLIKSKIDENGESFLKEKFIGEFKGKENNLDIRILELLAESGYEECKNNETFLQLKNEVFTIYTTNIINETTQNFFKVKYTRDSLEIIYNNINTLSETLGITTFNKDNFYIALSKNIDLNIKEKVQEFAKINARCENELSTNISKQNNIDELHKYFDEVMRALSSIYGNSPEEQSKLEVYKEGLNNYYNNVSLEYSQKLSHVIELCDKANKAIRNENIYDIHEVLKELENDPELKKLFLDTYEEKNYIEILGLDTSKHISFIEDVRKNFGDSIKDGLQLYKGNEVAEAIDALFNGKKDEYYAFMLKRICTDNYFSVSEDNVIRIIEDINNEIPTNEYIQKWINKNHNLIYSYYPDIADENERTSLFITQHSDIILSSYNETLKQNISNEMKRRGYLDDVKFKKISQFTQEKSFVATEYFILTSLEGKGLVKEHARALWENNIEHAKAYKCLIELEKGNNKAFCEEVEKYIFLADGKVNFDRINILKDLTYTHFNQQTLEDVIKSKFIRENANVGTAPGAGYTQVSNTYTKSQYQDYALALINIRDDKDNRDEYGLEARIIKLNLVASDNRGNAKPLVSMFTSQLQINIDPNTSQEDIQKQIENYRENTKSLNQKIHEAYNKEFGQGSFDKLLQENYSEPQIKTIENALNTGSITIAQRIFLATDGLGTTEDELRNIASLSLSNDYLKNIHSEYKELTGEDLNVTLKKELSGNDEFDILWKLRTDKTAKDAIVHARRLVDRESFSVVNLIHETQKYKAMHESLLVLEDEYLKVKDKVAPLENNQEFLTKFNDTVNASNEYRAEKEQIADTTVKVIEYGGIAVVTVATLGGASVPLVVGITAGAGATTMAAKGAIKSYDYGYGEMGTDLAMTAVNVGSVYGGMQAAKLSGEVLRGASLYNSASIFGKTYRLGSAFSEGYALGGSMSLLHSEGSLLVNTDFRNFDSSSEYFEYLGSTQDGILTSANRTGLVFGALNSFVHLNKAGANKGKSGTEVKKSEATKTRLKSDLHEELRTDGEKIFRGDIPDGLKIYKDKDGVEYIRKVVEVKKTYEIGGKSGRVQTEVKDIKIVDEPFELPVKINLGSKVKDFNSIESPTKQEIEINEARKNTPSKPDGNRMVKEYENAIIKKTGLTREEIGKVYEIEVDPKTFERLRYDGKMPADMLPKNSAYSGFGSNNFGIVYAKGSDGVIGRVFLPVEPPAIKVPPVIPPASTDSPDEPAKTEPPATPKESDRDKPTEPVPSTPSSKPETPDESPVDLTSPLGSVGKPQDATSASNKPNEPSSKSPIGLEIHDNENQSENQLGNQDPAQQAEAGTNSSVNGKKEEFAGIPFISTLYIQPTSAIYDSFAKKYNQSNSIYIPKNPDKPNVEETGASFIVQDNEHKEEQKDENNLSKPEEPKDGDGGIAGFATQPKDGDSPKDDKGPDGGEGDTKTVVYDGKTQNGVKDDENSLDIGSQSDSMQSIIKSYNNIKSNIAQARDALSILEKNTDSDEIFELNLHKDSNINSICNSLVHTNNNINNLVNELTNINLNANINVSSLKNQIQNILSEINTEQNSIVNYIKGQNENINLDSEVNKNKLENLNRLEELNKEIVENRETITYIINNLDSNNIVESITNLINIFNATSRKIKDEETIIHTLDSKSSKKIEILAKINNIEKLVATVNFDNLKDINNQETITNVYNEVISLLAKVQNDKENEQIKNILLKLQDNIGAFINNIEKINTSNINHDNEINNNTNLVEKTNNIDLKSIKEDKNDFNNNNNKVLEIQKEELKKIIIIDNMLNNIDITIENIKTKKVNIDKISNSNYETKLVIKNVEYLINTINLLNKSKIDSQIILDDEIREKNFIITNENLKELSLRVIKSKIQKFKELKKQKKYKEYLKFKVYETQRFLLLNFLQILLNNSMNEDDKKKELVKFLASLSPEIRKIIKPNEILKKILKSIGKDRIIALINNKKLQEIDKILANNQIDKNINF